MAKTYVNTVKYLIKINFEISGVVDKPDIVGAIFGQSEGLLGDEMDLKELQKNGKVGRIEITLKSFLGKTKGEILIPSSMDMVETSILAAAVESVDKVGPCEAKLNTQMIEDTRTLKRNEIIDRAKQLLRKLMIEQIPETGEIAEQVREDIRAADIETYGKDKLPCGPTIKEDNSIIIVEGRADVLNLLRNNIKNVIGMNGSKLSPDLIELAKHKSVTAFVDGDRGGDLNARKLQQLIKVDFIAKAPDGKEVEELQRKEIIMSLRRKIPTTQSGDYRSNNYQRYSYDKGPQKFSRMIKPRNDNRINTRYNPPQKDEIRPIEEQRVEATIEPKQNPEEIAKYEPIMKEIKGKLKAKLFDDKMKEITEVSVRELVKALGEQEKAKTVVFDGIITKRLAEEAEKSGLETVVGARKGKIEETGKVKFLTISS